MSILHTLNKSPFTHLLYQSCIELCSNEDTLLLIEDGVLAALPNAPCAALFSQAQARGVRILALDSDLLARGLMAHIRADIHTTDYTGFVNLSAQHTCIQNWY